MDDNSDTSNSSDDEDEKPKANNQKKDFLSPKFAGSQHSKNGELMSKLMKINGSATLRK